MVIFKNNLPTASILLLGLSQWPASTNAVFHMNVSSYLNFHVPHSLRHNESYPHRSAKFGTPYSVWGQEGSMILPVKLAVGDKRLCVEPSQEMIHKSWFLPKDSPFILLAERGGDCSFVRKARTAQSIGASALLIANEDDHLPRTMANDGSGQDISIPTMLIDHTTYEAVMKVMDQKRNHTGHVVAEIAWHKPKFENKVVLDFWHSPIDTHTKDFMTNFSVIAQYFDLSTTGDDSNDLLEFRAHPILLDGDEIGCTNGYDESETDPCFDMCTNGGRYCHISHRHISGKNIVMEALRRLCIRAHYKNQHVYWSYLNFFSEHCWDSDFFAQEACIIDAFHHSGVDSEKIQDCFDNTGDPKHDDINNQLDEALKMQKDNGIMTSPTIWINHDRTFLFGGLTTRNVLVALCDTFVYGEKPHVCYACMMCGDPVACSQRSPMQCEEGDGKEKEDPNAHKDTGGNGNNNEHKAKKKSHWGRWLFGLMLVGGAAGAFFYYKKQQEAEGDGLGSYSLQDAFLSESG